MGKGIVAWETGSVGVSTIELETEEWRDMVDM